jgi:hypothetical protein
MKKFLVLATVATLCLAGSAFAVDRSWVTQKDATFTFGAAGTAPGPSTTNNDDSCDISTAPAASLLLPYFEVGLGSDRATQQTTLFTITNVSRFPQIAHVVVWTDWSFAVLDFDIFLTGYDVQSINLYDILTSGVVALGTPSGTTSTPTSVQSPRGILSTLTNPNFAAGAVANCAVLPGNLPPGLVADVRTALTTGSYPSGCGATRVGGTHANAVGYITIDVMANCTVSFPGDPSWYTNLLYDNVLIGDYQQVNPNAATGNYAGGNPMVHLRAVPEGGPALSVAATPIPPTNLPYTFYDRYTRLVPVARNADRRQPLPALFAARYIQGGAGGFNTNYKIWREGVDINSPTTCSTKVQNSLLAIADIVRFDEHENPNTFTGGIICSPCAPSAVSLPETSSTNTSSLSFPTGPTSADLAGWMYLNLNNGGDSLVTGGTDIANYSFTTGGVTTTGPAVRPSQNWVIISMFAEGRYSVDYDAAWLGNGCSAAVAPGAEIAPAGGVLVCPGAAYGCTPGVAPYTGTNTTP